jgi:hypothetical protein
VITGSGMGMVLLVETGVNWPKGAIGLPRAAPTARKHRNKIGIGKTHWPVCVGAGGLEHVPKKLDDFLDVASLNFGLPPSLAASLALPQ